MTVRLEVVLQSEEQGPAPCLEGRFSGGCRIRVGLRQANYRHLARRSSRRTVRLRHQEVALRLIHFRVGGVLRKVDLLICDSGQIELPERMIQPVGRRDAELNLLPLGDVEVLVYAQVAVKVSRPVHVWEIECSLLTVRWRREAIRVEVCARGVFARVASNNRLKYLIGIAAKPGRWADSVRVQPVWQQDGVVRQVRCAD